MIRGYSGDSNSSYTYSSYVKVKHIERKFNVFAIVIDDEYAEIFADEYKSVVTFIDTLKFNVRLMLFNGYNTLYYYSQLPKIYINKYIEYVKNNQSSNGVNSYNVRPKPFTPAIIYGSSEPTRHFEIKEHCADPDLVIRKVNEKYSKIQTQLAFGNKIDIIDSITDFFREASSPAWRNHVRFVSKKECDEFIRIKAEVTRLAYMYCY